MADKETKHFLMKAFGVTQQTVWRALKFKKDTDQARRIRALALQKGGKLVGMKMPEWETIHEEAEHTMTLTYGERVRLVCNKETGCVSVYIDGRLEGTRKEMTVRELMQLQEEAERTACAL